MKGRLPVLLMSLVALALVLGLVATLAPGAGAQDSEPSPDGPAMWMRYNIPAPQDLQATCCTNAIPNGFLTQKSCCITIVPGGPITTAAPISATGVNPASAAATKPVWENRWFCSGEIK
jgi:hypothetical protein